MNTFYEILPDDKYGEIRVESLLPYEHGLLYKCKQLPVMSLPVKVSEGRRWYDVVRLQDIVNFTLSERVYRQLCEAKLTGWCSYDVDIIGVDKKYYGFQVIGSCGELKRPDQPGFIKGLDFDIETWDGSDFFSPQGTYSTLCTEKAHDTINAIGITNISMENIDTVEWYSS